MARILASSCLTLTAVFAIAAFAFAAETTTIEKRTYEEEHHSIEVGPAPAPVVRERTVVEERKVAPAIEKRTDTVVTTTDSDDDNDNDNK